MLTIPCRHQTEEFEEDTKISPGPQNAVSGESGNRQRQPHVHSTGSGKDRGYGAHRGAEKLPPEAWRARGNAAGCVLLTVRVPRAANRQTMTWSVHAVPGPWKAVGGTAMTQKTA